MEEIIIIITQHLYRRAKSGEKPFKGVGHDGKRENSQVLGKASVNRCVKLMLKDGDVMDFPEVFRE